MRETKAQRKSKLFGYELFACEDTLSFGEDLKRHDSTTCKQGKAEGEKLEERQNDGGVKGRQGYNRGEEGRRPKSREGEGRRSSETEESSEIA